VPISLVLDFIIAALLVLTIAYAVRLNQRLSQLRSDKNELLQLAKTFAEATSRAEVGIKNLKTHSEALQAEVNKARALKDDLSYLVERGGRAADEMVANVRAPMRSAQSESGVGLGMAASGGAGAARRDAGRDSDARLIEDAIRAASPQHLASQYVSSQPTMKKDMDPSRDDRASAPRRVTGHLANAGANAVANSKKVSGGASSARTPASLPSRGLGRELGRMVDNDEIEDTQSARELLKALSSVK